MSNNRKFFLIIILLTLLSGTMSLLGGIASNELAAYLEPYRSFALPVFVAGTFIIVGLAVWQARLERTGIPIDKSAPPPSEDEQNRRVMLDRVNKIWIEGSLERSLHGLARIELGLKSQPDAIEHPWDIVLEDRDKTDQRIPAGQSLLDTFHQSGRALLILGAPGCGKTTTLLELARDAVTRALSDTAEPIPVVFNLSSWSGSKLSIENWLQQELNSKYYVPKRIGSDWLRNNRLLLLLDGLDEVANDQRLKCIKALNKFRRNYGLNPIVVCSRSDDYKEIEANLRLDAAVTVLPLDTDQINRYTTQLGEKGAAIREALNADSQLSELAGTPLMLSVLTLAYGGESMPPRDPTASPEQRRATIFDAYIQRMLKRRGINRPYPDDKTLRWLAWLGRSMQTASQSQLMLEQIHPNWLGKAKLACATSVGIGVTLFVWLALFLGEGPAGGGYNLTNALMIWHNFGGLLLLIFLLGTAAATGKVSTRETFRWTWKASWESFQLLLSILLFVLFLGLVSVFKEIVERELGIWWWRAVLILVFLGALGMVKDTKKYDWRLITASRVALAIAISCLIYTLWIWGRDPAFTIEVANRIDLAVQMGQIGLIVVMLLALLGGLTFSTLESRSRINEGIHRSIRIATLVSSVIGILAWIILDRTAWLNAALVDLGIPSLSNASMAMLCAIVAGMALGGLSALKHYTTRAYLALAGLTPWRFTGFLTYAAERIFLQRIGGGFSFVHRMILEHFAAMPQPTERLNSTLWAPPALALTGLLCTIVAIYWQAPAKFHLNRGHYHLSQGRLDEALESYDYALELQSALVPALVARGYTYRQENMPDKALADFQQAINQAPDQIQAYIGRGMAFLDHNDSDAARDDFNHVIELEPNLATPYMWRGYSYYLDGHLDTAIKDYEHALRLDPKLGVARNLRSLAYGAQDKLDDALTEINHAVAQAPFNALARFQRSHLFASKGRYEQALADVARALELDPGLAIAHLEKGRILLNVGRPDEAQSCFSEALRYQPDIAGTLFNRAKSWLKTGQGLEQVRYWLESIIHLEPQNPDYRYHLALALFRLGETSAARTENRTAATLTEQMSFTNKEALVAAIRRLDDELESTDASNAVSEKIIVP